MSNPNPWVGIKEMPFEEYRNAPGVSKHDLDQLNRSPAHYKWYKENGLKETPALTFGRILHEAVLEPHSFAARVMVGPTKTRGTKAWESIEAQNPGKLIVTEDEHSMLAAIIKSVLSHPAASRLLGKGEAERCLFAEDKTTGLLLKGRPDFISHGSNVIADIKSCKDARPESFARDIYNYRYGAQSAYYLDLARALDLGKTAFVFIAVEKTPPYAVNCLQIDEDSIEHGRKAYRRDLLKLKKCLETNEWPSYSRGIEPISLPYWAFSEDDINSQNYKGA